MAFYTCQVCKYLFDDKSRGVPFDALPENWCCPECGAGKSNFMLKIGQDADQPENQSSPVLQTLPA
jgi:pyruvate oxidase